MTFTPKDKARLDAKFEVDEDSNCWNWTAGDDGYLGYGRFWFQGRRQQAHRVAYVIYVGPIPDGLVLDHLCRNARCVNPDHMEPVTQAENVRRGLVPVSNKLRAVAVTHCPANHEYVGTNLYVTSAGKRQCRACKATALVRWRRRFREARSQA